MIVSHTYDAAGWLTLIENYKSNGDAQSVFTYTYDKLGNRDSQAELNGVITTWTYDNRSQLQSETRSAPSGGFARVYFYDRAGNRYFELDADLGVQTFYIHDAANQLKSSSVGVPAQYTTYTYDLDGNQTRKETPSELTDFTWDEVGRLAIAHPVAGEVSFTYNAVGQRVAKETTSDSIRFLYDGLHLLEESDGANDPLREYTFGGEIL